MFWCLLMFPRRFWRVSNTAKIYYALPDVVLQPALIAAHQSRPAQRGTLPPGRPRLSPGLVQHEGDDLARIIPLEVDLGVRKPNEEGVGADGLQSHRLLAGSL